MDGAWNLSDSLRFRELTAEKVLTSMLVDQYEDKVRLVLYDTSNAEESVDIGAILVAENRAKETLNRAHLDI